MIISTRTWLQTSLSTERVKEERNKGCDCETKERSMSFTSTVSVHSHELGFYCCGFGVYLFGVECWELLRMSVWWVGWCYIDGLDADGGSDLSSLGYHCTQCALLLHTRNTEIINVDSSRAFDLCKYCLKALLAYLYRKPVLGEVFIMKFPLENPRKQVNWDPEQGRLHIEFFWKLSQTHLMMERIIFLFTDEFTFGLHLNSFLMNDVWWWKWYSQCNL